MDRAMNGMLIRILRAIKNIYVVATVAIVAVVFTEIYEPGIICGLVAAGTHSSVVCPQTPQNFSCKLKEYKDKKYLWSVMSVGRSGGSLEEGGAAYPARLNITPPNKVDFAYTSPGKVYHEFTGKCQEYGLGNILNSSEIIVGTLTRREIGTQTEVKALAFLVTQNDDKFVFFWCPTPLPNDQISRWSCASGLLSPQ
jgi:hypothetical protein